MWNINIFDDILTIYCYNSICFYFEAGVGVGRCVSTDSLHPNWLPTPQLITAQPCGAGRWSVLCRFGESFQHKSEYTKVTWEIIPSFTRRYESNTSWVDSPFKWLCICWRENSVPGSSKTFGVGGGDTHKQQIDRQQRLGEIETTFLINCATTGVSLPRWQGSKLQLYQSPTSQAVPECLAVSGAHEPHMILGLGTCNSHWGGLAATLQASKHELQIPCETAAHGS